MVIFYCCGCRAKYAAQPKRCPRCKGRAFSGVNDDAPTAALVDADAPPVVPENLDPDLARAFVEAERFRESSLAGRPYVPPARGESYESHRSEPSDDDEAPSTPRDMPEQP